MMVNIVRAISSGSHAPWTSLIKFAATNSRSTSSKVPAPMTMTMSHNGIHRVDQEVGGDTPQDRRSGNVAGDIFRPRRDEIGWRNAIFGVCTDSVSCGHPFAQEQRRHAVAHLFDGAAHVSAKDKRQFVGIQGQSESRCRRNSRRSPRLCSAPLLGPGLRLLDVGQDFWTSGFNGIHDHRFQQAANALSIEPATTIFAYGCHGEQAGWRDPMVPAVFVDRAGVPSPEHGVTRWLLQHGRGNATNGPASRRCRI